MELSRNILFLGIEQSVNLSHYVGEKLSSRGMDCNWASISANSLSWAADLLMEKSTAEDSADVQRVPQMCVPFVSPVLFGGIPW